MTALGMIALIAAGIAIGAAAAVILNRRSGGTGPAAPDVAGTSAIATAQPAMAGEETRELRAYTDGRFAGLTSELLEDLRLQNHAKAAALWRMNDGNLDLEMTAGDRVAVLTREESLEPMLQWSIDENVAHLGPDGDNPMAAVAPLGGPEERALGAVVLFFASPFVGDRASLKRSLQQSATRIGHVSELVRTHDELAKTNKRTRELLRETQNWDVEERSGDLGVRLCAMIERLTGADGSALIRWDDATQIGSVVVADGSCAQYAGSSVDEDSLAGTACRENVPQLWHEVSGRGEGPEALFSRALPTQTGCVIVHPLRRRASVIGAVVAAHRSPGYLGLGELRALSLFDAVASFRLASAWKLEEVTKRALVDGLTGLTNRRGFEIAMYTALEEQMRYGWTVSLVLVDVDHFKVVNDTHGHEAGDAALRAIAGTLEEGVRTTDVCARVGGEEMALILKDTGVDGARELAERLRVAIEALRVPAGSHYLEVTASFGVATYPTEVSEWDALYRTADRALYEAKQAGRNQVKGQRTRRSGSPTAD